jgi:hypothetical protein
MTSLEKRVRDFARFAATLKGGEKREAQTFLFHLLAAFGHDANTLPEGSTFEYRVRFPGERTRFADFVWPQSPTLAQVKVVAEAAVSLRALRRETMAANGWSLRELYRTFETPGANRLRDAHAALEATVRAAYGMKEGEDTLAFLLRLNLELAERETRGEQVTRPGLPATFPDPGSFASEDCLRAPT